MWSFVTILNVYALYLAVFCQLASPLICRVWFLYDRALRHERVRGAFSWLEYLSTKSGQKLRIP